MLADIISGIFHWFEDTYLDYCINIPFLSSISKYNELHHYFPRSIIAHSYYENISESLQLTICVLFVAYLLNKSIFKNIYFIMTFAIFCSISNLLHRFSHMRECENNWFINFMQNTGIFTSHSHHSLHHTTSTEKYCVISEYNNYILDSIYFWRALEYVIFLFTNIKPNRKQPYNNYHPIHNRMHENAKLECPIKPNKNDVDELIYNLKVYKNCDEPESS